MFGIHHERSPRVSSDFFLPSSPSVSLPPSAALQKTVRKVRGPISLIFCPLFSTSHLISFYFLLHLLLPGSPCSFTCVWFSIEGVFHLFLVLLCFSLLSPQTSGWIFLIFFFPPPPAVCLSVSPVSCLTLPFLPAVLSGVFQTFGACQEPPGLARLAPPFIPIRSDAGTRSSVSSQQQLQED